MPVSTPALIVSPGANIKCRGITVARAAAVADGATAVGPATEAVGGVEGADADVHAQTTAPINASAAAILMRAIVRWWLRSRLTRRRRNADGSHTELAVESGPRTGHNCAVP